MVVIKNGKRPTKNQKMIIKNAGFNPNVWLVTKNLENVMHVVNRFTGNERVIPKIARILVLMLVFLFTAQVSTTYAETGTEKVLEEQISLLEGRIALLEARNEVLEMQISLHEVQNTLLSDISQQKDSEIDRLWSFIRSTRDYQELIRIVEAEASGESLKGKMHVASVVLNRVDQGFAPTIHGVIHQPKQFSPVQDGRFNRVKVSRDSIEATEEIIRNGSVSNALYFMNPEFSSEKSRNWMRSLKQVTVVGNHEFYR